MCGIVAYSGYRNCYPILLQGLKKLEYRGYDSAGIALMNQEGIHIYKKVGEVSELVKWIQIHQETPPQATIGIGHTRWATHGMPSDLNAHPHISNSGKIAIVHNGIIENNNTLKKKLVNKGYEFKSETDTEVLANFIEDIKKCNDCSIETAIRIALSKVIGAYAIIVLDLDTPNTLIAAKRSSPMVVGIGKGELLLASDVVPLLAYTNEVVFMQDNDIIRIHNHTFSIRNLKNVLQTPYVQLLDIELEQIEKGDFDHFLLKEIYEQPTSIRNCLRGRLDLHHKNLILGGLGQYIDDLVQASKITIIACGTSWHAALVAEYCIEMLCKIPVEVEYASEFRYRTPIVYKGDIIIAISQSGETADTLAAVELAKSLGAITISICNVVESSLARMVHTGIYTHAGPEIGVASTKAFTAQLTTLIILALKVAYQRKSITEELFQTLLLELDALPDKIKTTLLQSTLIQEITKQFKNATNFLYLGRGYQFPIALEGALKLKEISYIHAEGYPAAEMKHGPLALIDEEMPVVFIAIQDRSYEKIISNIEEVKARKGKIIAITVAGDTRIQQLANYIIEVPSAHEMLMPILTIVPLQLFSYHIAVLRNCNVDKSRNLAKSVTVE